jgi:uncharacterized repeat protein (TIGR04076 family)
MSERHKVRITVLRRFDPAEVFKVSPVTLVPPFTPLGSCERYRDDQEFVIGEDMKMPEGFCTSAWVSLYPTVRMLGFGGNPPWWKEKGVSITCCNDGLRPVVFKLERI